MMVLEWVRRHSPVFAANVAKYLNTSGPITQIESQAQSGGGGATSPSLGIGSLKARS